jgi:hypothetical protein
MFLSSLQFPILQILHPLLHRMTAVQSYQFGGHPAAAPRSRGSPRSGATPASAFAGSADANPAYFFMSWS